MVDPPLRQIASHVEARWKGFHDKFAKARTNVDRIELVHDWVKRMREMPKFETDYKCNNESEDMRDVGNIFFRKGQYVDACNFYTIAIMAAENSSVEMAKAYANRSAVLFKLAFYREASMDIDRALANNYPAELKNKVLERKLECIKRQKQQRDSYHTPIPHLSDIQKNRKIKSASKSVKFSTNSRWGRHVVATDHMKIGEIIAVEKPYTATLMSKYILDHCNECVELCLNLIPCEHCTQVAYCSEKCKLDAFNAYHKYECPVLLTLVTQFEPALVPFRIVAKIRDDLTNIHSTTFTKQSMALSEKYREICALTGHIGAEHTNELLRCAYWAVFLCELFKRHTNFFNHPDEEAPFKEIAFLCLHLNTIRSATPISELQDGINEIVAIGLYPFSSTLKNSCNPNVIATNYGDVNVVRATRSIKPGEQLCVSFAFHYGIDDLDTRQSVLRSLFQLDCKCEACEGHWPSAPHMPMTTQRVILSQNIIDCLNRGDLKMAKNVAPRLASELAKYKTVHICRNVYDMYHYLVRCYKIFGNRRNDEENP